MQKRFFGSFVLVDNNVAAMNRRRVLVFALVTWLAIAAALLLPQPGARHLRISHVVLAP